MKDLVIIGAGGFGREVKTLIDDINKVHPTYRFKGFYDDGFEVGTKINGYEVLGGLKNLNNISTPVMVVVAIGAPDVKQKIVKQLINPYLEFPTLIHPSVINSDNFVDIGKGCIICAGNILTCNITIQDFVILNLMCTIGHDTTINKYSSFMPSVNISGEVLIHKAVYVGTGAKIINQLEIGENTIIGAGAVVSKSIPANCTAVGVPARIIKKT
ncbi:acetyltransferase [Aequorivita sediminis]|uniref:acetyltransferase n=1 Tax=Aequorivita sediminis TaxID=3073653 RepID=UPI0028AB8B59|nr:acetyltransferase [Aequorivita sp. F6058]